MTSTSGQHIRAEHAPKNQLKKQERPLHNYTMNYRNERKLGVMK